MNHNPPALYDYHQPYKSMAQLISDCGGGTDNNGITWQINGKYYAFPGENIQELSKKYSRWYPYISSKSIVLKGYGIPIPKPVDLAPGAMKEYERLIKTSHIKYIKVDNQTFVTRELNEKES